MAAERSEVLVSGIRRTRDGTNGSLDAAGATVAVTVIAKVRTEKYSTRTVSVPVASGCDRSGAKRCGRRRQCGHERYVCAGSQNARQHLNPRRHRCRRYCASRRCGGDRCARNQGRRDGNHCRFAWRRGQDTHRAGANEIASRASVENKNRTSVRRGNSGGSKVQRQRSRRGRRGVERCSAQVDDRASEGWQPRACNTQQHQRAKDSGYTALGMPF